MLIKYLDSRYETVLRTSGNVHDISLLFDTSTARSTLSLRSLALIYNMDVVEMAGYVNKNATSKHNCFTAKGDHILASSCVLRDVSIGDEIFKVFHALVSLDISQDFYNVLGMDFISQFNFQVYSKEDILITVKPEDVDIYAMQFPNSADITELAAETYDPYRVFTEYLERVGISFLSHDYEVKRLMKITKTESFEDMVRECRKFGLM